MHWLRWRKHGDPNIGAAKTKAGEAQAFFQRLISDHATDECIAWPFGLKKGGYGIIKYGDRFHSVHRLACEIVHGPASRIEHGRCTLLR